jgi:hypothetical protein
MVTLVTLITNGYLGHIGHLDYQWLPWSPGSPIVTMVMLALTKLVMKSAGLFSETNFKLFLDLEISKVTSQMRESNAEIK